MSNESGWKAGLKRVTPYGWWALPTFILGAGIGGCGVQLWLLGDAGLGSIYVGVGLAGLAGAAALAAQDASKRDEPEAKAQLKRIADGIALLEERSSAKLTLAERFGVLLTGKWPR